MGVFSNGRDGGDHTDKTGDLRRLVKKDGGDGSKEKDKHDRATLRSSPAEDSAGTIWVHWACRDQHPAAPRISTMAALSGYGCT